MPADFQEPVVGKTYVADDGTVSQVLDDTVDPNYEPTRQELEEYAEFIGMKLPEDEPYLWIAREGLRTSLPPEWKACRTDDGEVYYFNFKTGDSSWDHPLDEVFKKKFETEKAKGGARGGKKGGGAPAKRPSEDGDDSSDGSVVMHRPPSVGGSSFTGGGIGSGAGGAGSGSGSAGQAFVSEAERAMENRIRDEMRKAFEAEKQKADELLASRLESVHKLHQADVDEARAEDAKRRQALPKFDDEKRKHIAAARERFDDQYRDQLNDLEVERGSLTTQLSKIEAERQRSIAGQTERAQEEAKSKQDLERRMSSVTAEFKTMRASREKMAELEFSKKKAEVEAKNSEALKSASPISSPTSVFSAERQKLEAERDALDAKIRDAKSASAATAAVAVAAGGADSAKLKEIEDKKNAELKTLQTANTREIVRLKQDRELELSKLEEEKKSAAAAAANRSTDDSIDENGPVKVTVQKAAGPRVGKLPEASALFTRKLNALKDEFVKMKQVEMAALLKERDAKLGSIPSTSVSRQGSVTAVGTPMIPTVGSSSFSSLSGKPITGPIPEVQELRTEHKRTEAEREEQFKKMEEELTAKLAAELEGAKSVVANEETINKLIDDEMGMYAADVMLRRERMGMEMEQKREKMLFEHEQAMAAFKRREEESKRLGEQEKREQMEAFMSDELEEIVARERAKFEATANSVLSRRQSGYLAEQNAVKAEVDEEVDAYAAAERKKIEEQAAAAAAAAPKPEPEEAAPAGPTEEELAEEKEAQARHKEQRERLTSTQRRLVTLRSQHAAALSDLQRKVNERQNDDSALSRKLASPMIDRPIDPPSPAPAPAPEPIVRLVTRKVPPPDSTLRTAHRSRVAALEAEYQQQETALEAQLKEWRAKTAAVLAQQQQQQQQQMRRPGVPLAPVPAAVDYSALAAPSIASYTPPPPAPLVMAVPTTNTKSLDTTRYLLGQQRALSERQEALLSMRDGYRQQQQQQRDTSQQRLASSPGTSNAANSYRQPPPSSQQQQQLQRRERDADQSRRAASASMLSAVGSLSARLDKIAEGISAKEGSPSRSGGSGGVNSSDMRTKWSTLLHSSHLHQ